MLILGLGFFAPRAAHAVLFPSTCIPEADFHIDSDASTLTLTQGATGVSTITVTPINGFNKPITLAEANVPADLTVTLSATSLDLSGGPVLFTVTLKSSTSIASGDYSFVVNATTTTTLFHEHTINVHVPSPELGLSASKEFVTVQQSSSDTIIINLQSLYGLPGSSVDLTETISTSLTNPTYPKVALSSTSVTLTSGGTATSTLSVTTSSSTTPGPYSILVSGTASPGSVTNSTTITLIVTAPTFFLFPTPSSLKIPAGQSAHSTINVTSVLGFAGTVTLTAGLPIPVPGLTATPNPTQVVLPADSHITSDLTVDVSASVIPGPYLVIVTGVSGATSTSAVVYVTVPGPPEPGFSMTGSLDTLSVPQTNTTRTSTITLTSLNGFADTVSLSILCDPDGLTADITPSVLVTLGAARTASLSVYASSFTVPGNYTIDVFGDSSLASNSTSIKVTVTGPDFGLKATPSIVYMTTGGTTTSTITATGKLGFSGSIELIATAFSASTGVSTGLSGTLSKTTLSITGSTSDSAILTLTATAADYYGVEILGTSWPLAHTTEVVAVVTSPLPDFSVSVNPATLTIADGASSTSTIGLSPLYGFTGTVTLSATSPTGITATPSPTTISGTTTSTLTVSVTSAVTPGDYTVDVKGTSGTLERHATIALTVTSPTPTPDFDISATTPVSFTGGTTGTSTLSVTATNGFYSYVALTASAPSGMTVSFSPASIYPGTSTTTFSSSTPGIYAVTITGTSGPLVHTTIVQVTVTAVGSPDFTISRTPALLTIQAGNSGTSTITITPNNNFAGTVTLTALFLLGGPTATLSTTSISGGSGTSTLTINVASSVGAGTYTVTLQGTSDSLAHSTQVTVTVTSAPSTQPAASSPTILGLTPLVFYGIIGAVVVLVIIGGVTMVIRRRSP